MSQKVVNHCLMVYLRYSVYGTLVKYFGWINDGGYSEGGLQLAFNTRIILE